MDLKYKYLKYKQKYINIKQHGGVCNNSMIENCWIINAHGEELTSEFILPNNINIDYTVKRGQCAMTHGNSYADEYCENCTHAAYSPEETINGNGIQTIKEMNFSPEALKTYYYKCKNKKNTIKLIEGYIKLSEIIADIKKNYTDDDVINIFIIACRSIDDSRNGIRLHRIRSFNGIKEYIDFNDKKFVLGVVYNNGMNLKYASEELQGDPDVVTSAFINNPESIQFASNKLKHNKDFILNLIIKGELSLKYLIYKLRNDRDIVLAAIKNDGLELQFASDNLKRDSDIVSQAVNNNPDALKFALE
jgi:hypothetical protein